MGDSRSELLARIVDDVAREGLGDRSLRDLARAVGTSHRMLHYHFGSRDGVVAAVVDAVEARQRELMLAAAEGATSSADVVRAVWERVSSPEVRPFVQLFFETIAHASRAEHAGAEPTGPWLDDAAVVARRLGAADDPVMARLGVAVIRGLLVDVLATGDVDAATAALERFVGLWPAN